VARQPSIHQQEQKQTSVLSRKYPISLKKKVLHGVDVVLPINVQLNNVPITNASKRRQQTTGLP